MGGTKITDSIKNYFELKIEEQSMEDVIHCRNFKLNCSWKHKQTKYKIIRTKKKDLFVGRCSPGNARIHQADIASVQYTYIINWLL